MLVPKLLSSITGIAGLVNGEPTKTSTFVSDPLIVPLSKVKLIVVFVEKEEEATLPYNVPVFAPTTFTRLFAW